MSDTQTPEKAQATQLQSVGQQVTSENPTTKTKIPQRVPISAKTKQALEEWKKKLWMRLANSQVKEVEVSRDINVIVTEVRSDTRMFSPPFNGSVSSAFSF